MTIEWIAFLTWVVTVWVALEAYRERSEMYAEAIMSASEHIAIAITEAKAKENTNA